MASAKEIARRSMPRGRVGAAPGRVRWRASITSLHTGAAPLVPERRASHAVEIADPDGDGEAARAPAEWSQAANESSTFAGRARNPLQIETISDHYVSDSGEEA